MTDLRNSTICWRTKKNDDGSFSFKVFAVTYGQPVEILADCKEYKSRAIAANRAKRWVRYYKRIQRRQQAA